MAYIYPIFNYAKAAQEVRELYEQKKWKFDFEWMAKAYRGILKNRELFMRTLMTERGLDLFQAQYLWLELCKYAGIEDEQENVFLPNKDVAVDEVYEPYEVPTD